MLVLHNVMFDSNESFDGWCSRLTESGYAVRTLYDDHFESLADLATVERAYFFVSINAATRLQRYGVRGFLKFFNLKPSMYLPVVHHCCFCDVRSYFKPANMLQWHNEPVFIKPDTGLKTYTGGVITSEAELKFLVAACQPDDMCLVAPVSMIIEEWRFWIYQDVIVGHSQYHADPAAKRLYTKSLPDSVCDFVKCLIAEGYSPDDAYVVDVGVSDKGDTKLIEYNCFSTSGFYNADLLRLCSIVGVPRDEKR